MVSGANSSGAIYRVRVWDFGVRLFHWSLVATVAAAYLSEDLRSLHKILGYAVGALIAFRLFWGFVGPRNARFVTFVPTPTHLAAYLLDMLKGREKRYLGHNPAGGAMIVTLLAMLTAVGVTGHMMGMDAYFGAEWVEDAHEIFVDGLIILIVLHVAGVVYSSLRHRENLVASMVSGQKDADE